MRASGFTVFTPITAAGNPTIQISAIGDGMTTKASGW
jgi:predicted RNA-binding protein with TRAM domain